MNRELALWIINILVGICLAITGFVVNNLHVSSENLTQSVHQTELNLANNYVRRDDLSEIKSSLRRIEDKLETKADKAGR